MHRQRHPFLLQPVMDLLDGLEPGQPRIVDMMCLVVQYRQFVDIPDDYAQVHTGVGGRAGGLWPQEVIHGVLIVETAPEPSKRIMSYPSFTSVTSTRWRHELFHAGLAHGLIRRKPADGWVEDKKNVTRSAHSLHPALYPATVVGARGAAVQTGPLLRYPRA